MQRKDERKRARLRELEEERRQKEMAECSFQPRLGNRRKTQALAEASAKRRVGAG